MPIVRLIEGGGGSEHRCEVSNEELLAIKKLAHNKCLSEFEAGRKLRDELYARPHIETEDYVIVASC